MLHLLAQDEWKLGTDPLAPPSLEAEGFVHCTDDDATLLRVANHFYRSIPGRVVALTIDTERVGCETIWEHPPNADPLTALRFPHIYGPVPRDAVESTRVITRDDDGAYIGFGPARPYPTTVNE